MTFRLIHVIWKFHPKITTYLHIINHPTWKEIVGCVTFLNYQVVIRQKKFYNNFYITLAIMKFGFALSSKFKSTTKL